MYITKAILTSVESISDLLVNRFGLERMTRIDNMTIYEGMREIEGAKEQIVLIQSGIANGDTMKAARYILENYDIEKFLNIGFASNLENSEEIQVGDVFLPNTFLMDDSDGVLEGKESDNSKAPIFLDYAVGESYDLKKFGLILSGVCLSCDVRLDTGEGASDLREKYGADIIDKEAFVVLSVAREYNILDKCVVIKTISEGVFYNPDEVLGSLDFVTNNTIEVLDLVL